MSKFTRGSGGLYCREEKEGSSERPLDCMEDSCTQVDISAVKGGRLGHLLKLLTENMM